MKIKNWILCITVAITLIGGSALSTAIQKVATENPIMALIDHGIGDHKASS
ncbi:hypothetical protein ERICIV_03762 [Paenibacillus larvae subsp. larvae]|uniref:Uncharacterized protein n=1 Tax=Paenibacillus larvae subsp. larvae TaxID=147375 RepID=A0A2L1U5B1_9BACL|nr:hypothetical protein [Paenibacillus larvae]AVF28104.1 hypothetical protein ERICIII_04019 [Paenibacillus larvae subsp. larvae]AVF32607.1 hypothetical protein ERICIV_03762 [Paenibacillus larvae subsp. larvae]MCY7521072.1 hypothetical protein [Paenibacillus larvae]MCY9499387.1 hypothetical protein [Paenibacillus larvae]MCY9511520.1 hypothetical protein [Paenibacillus larvae]